MDVEKFIKKRLCHSEMRARSTKRDHGDRPGFTHTYHAGWNLGYWDGKSEAYQDMLDNLEGMTVIPIEKYDHLVRNQKEVNSGENN